MQVTLTHNSATRKSLEIVFPAPAVDSAFESVVADVAKKVKIQGFRPGKVPKSVLMSKYQREIANEVAEKLVEEHFWEAVSSVGLKPISRPAVEKSDVRESSEGKVKIQFDVAPEVKLPEYKGLTLAKKKRLIDDAFIDSMVAEMQEEAAKLVPVEGGAELGHTVAFDLRIKPQGMKARHFSDEEAVLEGSIPFHGELIGLKAGDAKKFSLAPPEGGANKPMAAKMIHYDVFIKSVSSTVLPEINDEFAKDMGSYESLADLKEKLRKSSEDVAEAEAMGRLQGEMLDQLLNASSFEVPASMVNLQLDDYCREFADKAASKGISPKKIKWGAYRRNRLIDAERAVRSGYLLQSLGNAEDIQVSDEEIDHEIKEWMKETDTQEPFETVKASFEKQGATTEIMGRVRTEKIFDMLLKTAVVTEELLDMEAFNDLLEIERRREEGIAQARFDAGGLQGGDFEDQEGGEPEAIVPAEEAPAQTEEAQAELPSEEEEEEEKEDDSSAEATAAEATEAAGVDSGGAALAETEALGATDAPDAPDAPDAAPAKRGRPKKAESAVSADNAGEAKEKPKRSSRKKGDTEG